MLVIFLYLEVLLFSNQKVPCWACKGTKPSSYKNAQHQNQLRCWSTKEPALFVFIKRYLAIPLYLPNYIGVFGFMVVRGVCRFYWLDQNKPHTANFSWPWWMKICTFQLDKSSHFLGKLSEVCWLLAVKALWQKENAICCLLTEKLPCMKEMITRSEQRLVDL